MDGSLQHQVSSSPKISLPLSDFAGFLLFLFGIFIILELKGRSLEETDELFEAHLKFGWQFATCKTQGTGAKIAALQNENFDRFRKLSVASGLDEKAGRSDSGEELRV